LSNHTAVIVLAAGKGTRMRSRLPKVLHPVAGVPMVEWVVRAAEGLSSGRVIVVTGHESEQVRSALAHHDVTFVEQTALLGTADAVRRCRDATAGFADVLVVNGDCPLVQPETLERIRSARGSGLMAFVTAHVAEPGRLGRVIRGVPGYPERVVEAAEYEGPAGPAEVNAGQYCFDAAWLWEAIERVPQSASGELYLPHLVSAAHAQGHPASTVVADPGEILGVDDRERLAEAEAEMRQRILRQHMRAGVTIADPRTTYIDGTVTIEEDVTILQGCWLSGRTAVATGAVIGPNTTLRDSSVGLDSRVHSSVIEESSIGRHVHLGPFAHVRGGSEIGDGCAIGNYAEVNRSKLGPGVKMHHFSYLGDATVGEGANIAAGVITCNYDGVNKNPTVIGAGAFVGCDTMLVAPVSMGDGAQTGAGTVLNRDLGPRERAVGVPARVIGRREGERGGG
jgi:bifunctional UDP-N-acetylglucosamine pyrophosphorylase/glucosamine-1-phosphate N-acetyltransferase